MIQLNSYKFIIIGSGLSEKTKKKYLTYNNDISYMGFVENPLEVIYESRAVIAPLFRGAGIKIKVIDAFTTGTPVIGTDIAFEGLPVLKNLVYLTKRPQEYANIINNFQETSYKEKKENAKMFRLMYGNNHLLEQI
jgi:glycosyltransferase involved in cell wall biosynthesis